MKKAKKHEPHEEHIDESWLLPYSDLMTLLLALFIILFAMSSIDAAKFEQMASALSSALNGGSGILDHSSMNPDTPGADLGQEQTGTYRNHQENTSSDNGCTDGSRKSKKIWRSSKNDLTSISRRTDFRTS